MHTYLMLLYLIVGIRIILKVQKIGHKKLSVPVEVLVHASTDYRCTVQVNHLLTDEADVHDLWS